MFRALIGTLVLISQSVQASPCWDIAPEARVSQKRAPAREPTAHEDLTPAQLAKLQKAEEAAELRMQKQLAQAYAKAASHYRRPPTLQELSALTEVGTSDLPYLIDKHFNGMAGLKQEAFRLNPRASQFFVDTEIYNEAYKQKVLESIRKADRVIVTSAVGAKINKLGLPDPVKVKAAFLDALVKYSETHGDAPIIVKPVDGMLLDPEIAKRKNVYIVPWELELDRSLSISELTIPSDKENPLSGLERVGRRGQKQIFASPKSWMVTVATTTNHLQSHIMYTTGAVTEPNYPKGTQSQQARMKKAKQDHYMSALVLQKSFGQSITDIKKHGFFHVRRVVYVDDARGFTDLTDFYTASEVRRSSIESIANGDTHVLQTDPLIFAPHLDMIRRLDPRYDHQNDLITNSAVSKWDEKDSMLMMRKFERGELDLLRELNAVRSYIMAVVDANPKITMIIEPANHNDWLRRWLVDDNRKISDVNAGIYLELKYQMKKLRFDDPFAYWIMENLPPNYRNRVRFLKQGQNFPVGENSVEMGLHGDKGDGLAKPSMLTFQRGADASGHGHTHTAQIRNNTVNFGTTTPKELDYAVGGFSKTVQATLVVDVYGAQTLLEFQHGEWARFEPLPEGHEEFFFREGFPRIPTN